MTGRYDAVQRALPGHGSAGPGAPMMAEQAAYIEAFRVLVDAARTGADVGEAGLADIRAAMAERFPVAPGDLIAMNAQAVARELAG